MFIIDRFNLTVWFLGSPIFFQYSSGCHRGTPVCYCGSLILITYISLGSAYTTSSFPILRVLIILFIGFVIFGLDIYLIMRSASPGK